MMKDHDDRHDRRCGAALLLTFLNNCDFWEEKESRNDNDNNKIKARPKNTTEGKNESSTMDDDDSWNHMDSNVVVDDASHD